MSVSVEPVRFLEPAFDEDTWQARMIRAEEQARVLAVRINDAQNALNAVDQALAAEHAPVHLTACGRIRWLGDQRRKAERTR